MNGKPRSELPLVRPISGNDVYQRVTPDRAGWKMLHFEARTLRKHERWQHRTEGNEHVIVILSGTCTVISSKGTWREIGQRTSVFDGMPSALYLPRDTEFTVMAETPLLDIACGWCPAQGDRQPLLVTPDMVSVEIRGGGNATRQINSIMPPGSPCDALVAVEVFTPSGNWSSYPPHKHDVHRMTDNGQLLEADLEEIYFYKIDPPRGFAMQRLYSADGTVDDAVVAHHNDIVLVRDGYHPVAAAPGYNVYYLNILAGSAQSLASMDDPDHQWVKATWNSKDPRVPLVTLNGAAARPSEKG
jgi:5-deoxy-glucuronate isomerase